MAREALQYFKGKEDVTEELEEAKRSLGKREKSSNEEEHSLSFKVSC